MRTAVVPRRAMPDPEPRLLGLADALHRPNRWSPARGLLLAVAVLAIAVPAIASSDLAVPGRAALAVAFVLCVPGVPMVMALRLPSRLLSTALALATSLAVAVIHGTAAIVMGWWHPRGAAWILAITGLMFAVVACRRLRPEVPPTGGWVAHLDDGRKLRIEGSLLVGRQSAAPPINQRGPILEVANDHRTVSREHLKLDVGPQGLAVLDCGSTNGSWVTRTDGFGRRCTAGKPTYLDPGSIVSFGEHWLRVEREVDDKIGSSPASSHQHPLSAWATDVTGAAVQAFSSHKSRVVALALTLAAVALWWLETRRLPLDQTGVLGLLPVVGWRYVLALILVSAVVVYSLLKPRVDHVVLTVCAVVVALVGYATVAVSDGHGSVPVGWVHVGFVQYISEHGTVPESFDARFSWPGFFAAAAQLVSLAGTPDARTFLALAPAMYAVLALPGLLLIARSITRSWRWSWVAVFVFLLTNWYQQDYFSPQATAFVMYVTVLGTLLWMLGGAVVAPLRGGLVRRLRQMLTRTPGLPEGLSVRTAQLVCVLLAGLILGIVVGHQLTPISLIFCLLAFTLTGLTRYRTLWLVAALALGGWFSYGATDYWLGHLSNILGELGQVQYAVDASVSGRLIGDPTYQSAQLVRIGWSALLFGAAAVGAWSLRRWPMVVLVSGLAFAPFGLLLVQSYGGEVIIRCFLYASPVLAPLAATGARSAIAWMRRQKWAGPGSRGVEMTLRPRLGWTAALVPVVVLAALILTFTRGLNVSFERTPPQQVLASQTLYDLAQPGDQVAMASSVGLSPYLDITDVSISYLMLEDCTSGPVERCTGTPMPEFVLLTATQERYGELTEDRPAGWFWQFGDRLLQSGQYVPVYQGVDAVLLERAASEES